MNTTQRAPIMQLWNVLRYELMPDLRVEVGVLTPKLEKVVHTLEPLAPIYSYIYFFFRE